MDTQNAIILEMLTAAAGREVPMPLLATSAECLNVHTRCSELRKKHGHNILNRTEHDAVRRKRKHSFYWIPVEVVTED